VTVTIKTVQSNRGLTPVVAYTSFLLRCGIRLRLSPCLVAHKSAFYGS